jgi:hypothetical protein
MAYQIVKGGDPPSGGAAVLPAAVDAAARRLADAVIARQGLDLRS